MSARQTKVGRRAATRPDHCITKREARALSTNMADFERKHCQQHPRAQKPQFGKQGNRKTGKRRGPHRDWKPKYLAALKRLGSRKLAAKSAGVSYATVNTSLLLKDNGFPELDRQAYGRWIERQIQRVASGDSVQFTIGQRGAAALLALGKLFTP